MTQLPEKTDRKMGLVIDLGLGIRDYCRRRKLKKAQDA